jgi:3-oxoadipate enol-lactonase
MKLDISPASINVAISGNKNGPMVLMAHSLGCDLHMWDPQMDVLEKDYHVVRLDMRGHGASETSPGPYTLEALADDVIAVMDELSIAETHWVGLSIGGMIGQSLLLRYPDRFISATLCDTSSIVPGSALSAWAERVNKVETEGLESIADATMERWFTADFRASAQPAVEKIRTQFIATSDAGYIACCRAIMQLNYTEQLTKIETPTCVIVGSDDIATPVAASETIHKRISGSTLHVLDNAAHLSNIEQNEIFNRILTEFLQSHSV